MLQGTGQLGRSPSVWPTLPAQLSSRCRCAAPSLASPLVLRHLWQHLAAIALVQPRTPVVSLPFELPREDSSARSPACQYVPVQIFPLTTCPGTYRLPAIMNVLSKE